MTKQMVPGKERIQKIYWILVAITCALLVSVHPVMAETIFDRFSTIMRIFTDNWSPLARLLL